MAYSSEARTSAQFDEQQFGERIRELRTERRLSLRGLAERLDISPSALSQIERGKMRPSVTRLYQIMSELDVPMASVFGEERTEAPAFTGLEGDRVTVTRDGEAPTLVLDHGVRYRRLTAEALPGMNYFESTYPPGSFSSQNAEYVWHNGHEVGLVVSGALTVDVGFETYELAAGDSIVFPSTTPHRISNRGDHPAVAIWLNLA